jgi:putative toxin-antitoxin system antitoxin component (TIGR02293 family)
MQMERLVSALAGCSTLPKKIDSELGMYAWLKKGLPFEAVDILIKNHKITLAEMQHFIPSRTFARRKQECRLNIEESDKVARLAIVIDFAEEVFDNNDKANIWLRRPNRALNGFRPIELLETDYGTRIVETVLGRIQYGVYS